MTAPEENPTDEELADLMNDSETTGQAEDADAGVEVGIPPEIDGEDSEFSSDEETFSMDDFDSTLSASQAVDLSGSSDSPPAGVEESESEGSDFPEPATAAQLPESAKPDAKSVSVHANGGGEVSEFRKTLANLARQLEVDKLAFLHKSLREGGEPLPSLEEIADDIQGKKPMFPQGDCDRYSTRPTSRLDGWISGLSFGANRRAKKFSK